MNKFDIIIIGGGNAGIEVIKVLNKNYKILLITNNIDNIGVLSCNPSIGGIGKSNLVEEIDKLNGLMGKLTDESMINFKNIRINNLNLSRAQIDRNIYKIKTQNYIKNLVKISQEIAIKLIIKNNKIIGVITNINKYKTKIIVLTTGTFLNGIIFIGKKKFKGGRINDLNKNKLSNQLKLIIPNFNRFKTGTSPRLSGKLIFKNIKKQKSDIKSIKYYSNKSKKKYIFKNCWITKIKKKTINIIKNNLKFSPLFKNIINGVGPRYCPSLEDKIYRFYKKSIYNIFIEPENIKSNEFYLNGLSTSLPLKIQIIIIKSIKNLNKTNLIRPGYSVEYDFFEPKNLKKSLESKYIKNLFLAGQINGTTGYEEAAAQGIISGVNINLKLKFNRYWYPNKFKSYIGVLIDDLIKKNIKEPYRIIKKNLNLWKNIKKIKKIDIKNIFKNLKLIKFYKNKLIPIINFNKLKNLSYKNRNILNKYKPKILSKLILINFKVNDILNIILFFKNY